ncbi:serine hydrolase domain-containing protein [Ichthyobacterium seriolicida]|uniref:Beta-lactamase n=1 Tax=Ichthyobacterium seriolicida TaxID=242600 RepID=A0A1J1E2R5_9FLAO|nr:serine hydrolase [Ichthyobacterium seriolicida]BAV95245.1 beta-lactamase [Ichthyobacterium seriolicida]
MKKNIFLKGVAVFVTLLSAIVIVIFVTDNTYLFNGVRLTYLKGEKSSNIDDGVDFPYNVIETSEIQPWEKDEKYNQIELSNSLKEELKKSETTAFLIIKDSKIIKELYFDNYNQNSLTNSFSMAKTMVTLLLGAAIQDGFIKSLDQPITDFLPEFIGDDHAEKTTIRDLSAMTAGYSWVEDYHSPFSNMAKAYYGNNLEKLILSINFNKESGKEHEYLSGVTQLLSIIIMRTTKQSLSEYLSLKFWKPMGMRSNALWSKDDPKGMEKGFCCVHSNARDFAKLGRLLMQKGNWNGNQLIDSTFVSKMITPNYKAFKNKPAIYGYSLWTDYQYNPIFYSMIGHLGQVVICIPSKNIIICRLGKKKNKTKEGAIPGGNVYYYVDEVLKII